MRLIQLIMFVLISHSTSGQKIYDYEQKINRVDELEFKEISFSNAEEKIQLSGTLVYPKKGYEKIVIIVPGSGKDSRHSHNIIAENFLKHNIAVYRFDDRGIGDSSGKFDDTASSLIRDVICIYQGFKKRSEVSNKKIGILGHSLGGIASIGAYEEGCNFDFLVQMATPVENNGAFLKYQATSMDDGWSNVKNKSPIEVINFLEELSKIISINDDFKTTKVKAKPIIKKMNFKKGRHIVNPIIIDLIKQNHEKTYQSCSVPILYIIGSKDQHVNSATETKVLEKMNNKNIEVKIVQGLDHYLTMKEDPRYFINTEAMNKIINWVSQK